MSPHVVYRHPSLSDSRDLTYVNIGTGARCDGAQKRARELLKAWASPGKLRAKLVLLVWIFPRYNFACERTYRDSRIAHYAPPRLIVPVELLSGARDPCNCEGRPIPAEGPPPHTPAHLLTAAGRRCRPLTTLRRKSLLRRSVLKLPVTRKRSRHLVRMSSQVLCSLRCSPAPMCRTPQSRTRPRQPA